MNLADLTGKTIKQVTQESGATLTENSFWELAFEFIDGTTLKLLPWMYCADDCIIDTKLERRE